MKLYFIFAICILNFNSFASEQPQATGCKDVKVEDCVEFQGRARAYMGRAETRIWKIGSNRLFAVREKTSDADKALSQVNFHQDVFGKFRVCPTSKYVKGEMQLVCVEQVSKVTIKPTGQ